MTPQITQQQSITLLISTIEALRDDIQSQSAKIISLEEKVKELEEKLNEHELVKLKLNAAIGAAGTVVGALAMWLLQRFLMP